MEKPVVVIGAGLAGSEAALQLAHRGIPVRLIEMRPVRTTPVHHTDRCAELVCSNSLKSTKPQSAAGMLKEELSVLGSFLYACACKHAVPAGGALAVDREAFSREVTALIEQNSYICFERREVTSLAREASAACAIILATGPLTSDELANDLMSLTGSAQLAFYDAAAPIVMADSLDIEKLFCQNRYEQDGTCVGASANTKPSDKVSVPANAPIASNAQAGQSSEGNANASFGNHGDYLNAAFTKAQYQDFIEALLAAQRVCAKDFETKDLFQACQPIEEVARSGVDAPRFGPMKPVGLLDPRTGKRPWAAVQLRAENREATAYNLVGFQTNLTFSEQKRVFRMIPGLEHAEFARFGVMHRNTFIDAPQLLDANLQAKGSFLHKLPVPLFVAGQLAGTEGYCEAIRSGLHVAINLAAKLAGRTLAALPAETVFGSLLAYATNPATHNYQPMHVNFGILPAIQPPIRAKAKRYAAYAQRGHEALCSYRSALEACGFLSIPAQGE